MLFKLKYVNIVIFLLVSFCCHHFVYSNLPWGLGWSNLIVSKSNPVALQFSGWCIVTFTCQNRLQIPMFLCMKYINERTIPDESSCTTALFQINKKMFFVCILVNQYGLAIMLVKIRYRQSMLFLIFHDVLILVNPGKGTGIWLCLTTTNPGDTSSIGFVYVNVDHCRSFSFKK